MIRDIVPSGVRREGGRATRRGRMLSRHHPRLLMAAKTACAAALAWLAVQPFGGFVRDYPYYAPLGAVMAMATTVADSARYMTQTVLAILTGAMLAMLVREAQVGDLVGIAFVAGVGTLLAGWPLLGSMAGWVPGAGLFVLVVGGHEPRHYILAYAGLTAVGALIGVAVNAALPQLPLAPATRAQAQLRATLAQALDDLADALSTEKERSSGSWEAVSSSIDPHIRRVDELLRIGMDGQRANWRARRWADLTDRRYRQSRSLRRLAGCVEQVVTLASTPDASWHDSDERGETLRKAIAAALRRTGVMIRSLDEEDPDAGGSERDDAVEAIRELRETVTSLPHDAAGRSALDAAAVVVGLERAVMCAGADREG